MKYFMIEETELEYLRNLRSRMHSEIRMNGDEMRDVGHSLDTIVRNAIEVPEKETL